MSETTLAQHLNDAFDKVEAESTPVEQTPASAPLDPEQTDPGLPASAPEEKPGRTAGRARDEHGRLLPGKAVRPDPAPAPAPAQASAAPQVEPPSSWKKEYWDAYKSLPPNVAQYIKQREEQYINGVTTYRQEAEAAREVRAALAPYEQDFRAAGVTPAQGIVKLAEAHRNIRNASPEGKIAIFQRLAQDYGVPLHAIQSGQVDPMMQYVQPLQQQLEELRSQQHSWVEQQRNAEQSSLQSEIENFAAQHEHFEAVRPVMAGLLQSGLAKDLTSAYEKALRIEGITPAAAQPQLVKTNPAAAVQKARAAAVSTKSATPTTVVPQSGKKDVRSILEDTVEQFLGGARV